MLNMTEKEIIALIEEQARNTNLSESTVCERAVGNTRGRVWVCLCVIKILICWSVT